MGKPRSQKFVLDIDDMRNIERHLRLLGLPDDEARILGVLYEQSPVGASFIAKRLDLSRSTVYTAIASLTAKGLASTTYRNEVKQFVPAGPETLERMVQQERKRFEEKEKLVADLKGHLAAVQRPEVHVPQVMLFEGVEGLKRIYLSMLRDAREGDTMIVLRDEFIWRDEWAFSWEQEWQERVKRYKTEKRIRTKLLVNPSKLEREKASFYRTREGLEFRCLPKAHAVDRFALYVVGDVAAIMSFETGNLIGIKITNAHLAANFVTMFDGLWSLSVPTREK
jgi:sugar-specific transcriptional regulator TrmB